MRRRAARARHAPAALLAMLVLLSLRADGAVAAASRGARQALPTSGSTQSARFCAPLPPPEGPVTRVRPEEAGRLDEIVAAAAAGQTILLEDGFYPLEGDWMLFARPDVTLRSASGRREAVVLDGGYRTTEIAVIRASGVTLASLTLRRARFHPVHVTGDGGADVQGVVLHDLVVEDPGQQAIKVNADGGGGVPDAGRISCSRIVLTDAGRPKVWEINGSCYTGGVDVHQARGWVVRDNEIEGFWCARGLSEHGIHFWRGARDTRVLRNRLRDNARGIGFGLGRDDPARLWPDEPCDGLPNPGHVGGLIAANALLQARAELRDSEAGYDCGICLAQACGARVAHNSVVADAAAFSSIEWRFGGSDPLVENNLVSHRLLARDGAEARMGVNLRGAEAGLFEDLLGGDLRLRADAVAAIDAGRPLDGADGDLALSHDLDGDPRDALPDLGADERASPMATAVEPTSMATVAPTVAPTAASTVAPTATRTVAPIELPTATPAGTSTGEAVGDRVFLPLLAVVE